MRIVSLVPSLTELIVDLGLHDELVGRTKFCIHPLDKIGSIPKIGGTKNVNVQAVLDLKPDLIIANKEENLKEDIEKLLPHCKVLVTEIKNYNTALEAIQTIGKITNRIEKSIAIIENIKAGFSKLSIFKHQNNKVCYLIWNKPIMSIGNDTFIHNILIECGFANIFQDRDRYPTSSVEEIQDKNPDYVFLSSEPFPFKEKHVLKYQELFPNAKVVMVNGEYFSWYGSRMVMAPEYFNSLIESLAAV